MSVVVDLEEFRMQRSRCAEEPTTERCTTRLRMGTCPGIRGGTCTSPKFDPKQHNQQLPLFFAAQH